MSQRPLFHFTNITLIHIITKQLHHAFFLRNQMRLKNYHSLQLLVKKFTMYSLSASHKHEIPELKENYAHGVLGPIKCIQMLCYWLYFIILDLDSLSLSLKKEKVSHIRALALNITISRVISIFLHIMCIRRWNTKHVTLYLFKGLKLRSLSLSPRLSKPLCEGLVKMRCKSHVRLSNQKDPSPHMLCFTSGPLMAQSLP